MSTPPTIKLLHGQRQRPESRTSAGRPALRFAGAVMAEDQRVNAFSGTFGHEQ